MPFLIKSVCLVLVYFASARLGLSFGTINSSVTIIWPAGGIALAVLLLGGVRYLPAVFVGAILAGITIDVPLIFSFGSAIGNTLETYIGYVLLHRYAKIDTGLNSLRDLFAIVLLGGLVAVIASAVIGPFSLLLSGLINESVLPDVMWRWWRGDALGISFITPLVLVFAHKRPFFRNANRFLESIALWIVSIALGQMIFLGWSPMGILSQPLGLAWLFPVLIWSGLRAGRRNTALIQLLFLVQALASAHFTVGVFADDFSKYGLSNFWAFAMLLAILGMALAIMSTYQRRCMWKAQQNAKVFEISDNGVMIVDKDNLIISINTAFTDITGYFESDVIGQDPRLLASGRHNRAFYVDMWKSLIELGKWQGEVWNRRKDGSIYLERLSIHTIADSYGNVVSRVGIFSDITLERSRQEVFIHQAQHDFLTNLPNRLLFCDRFVQQLAFAHRHGTKFAVIYLDLDKFKLVNDTLGHQIGDLLLVAGAQRLSSLVRQIDTVSRFGGDEFAILVSEVDTVDDVTALAKKILNILNEPFKLNGHVVNVSGSLGVALYPDHGMDMETILNNADTAMYQAKSRGGNTYLIMA